MIIGLLFCFLFLMVFGYGQYPMIYDHCNNTNNVCEVENKKHNDLFSGNGTYVIDYFEFLSFDFIDYYTNADLFYNATNGQSFTIWSIANDSSRLVLWYDFNSSYSDYGFSHGEPVVYFSFSCYGSGSNGFSRYQMWNLNIVSSSYDVVIDFHVLSNNSSTDKSPYSFVNFSLSFTGSNNTPIFITQNANIVESLTSKDYKQGYNDGLNYGYNNGYTEGYDTGYQLGYSNGVQEGLDTNSLPATIFTGALNVGLLPVNVFLQMFNYEVFGINNRGNSNKSTN